ncbi:hypothetical protein ACWD4N_47555 [Streptomyces sp. NPDC002586]
MPEPFATFLTAGIVIAGLGLILRINRGSTRPTHTAVTQYGTGLMGVAIIGAILTQLTQH